MYEHAITHLIRFWFLSRYHNRRVLLPFDSPFCERGQTRGFCCYVTHLQRLLHVPLTWGLDSYVPGCPGIVVPTAVFLYEHNSTPYPHTGGAVAEWQCFEELISMETQQCYVPNKDEERCFAPQAFFCLQCVVTVCRITLRCPQRINEKPSLFMYCLAKCHLAPYAKYEFS